MPFVGVAERESLGPIAPLPPEQEPVEPVAPGLGQVLPAAFRRENTLGSLFLHRKEDLGKFDANYDPVPEIVGTPYEDYLDAFLDVGSPADVATVKRRIDAELEDSNTLRAAGMTGVAASMAAGLLDPIVLVPVGGAVSTGGNVLARGLRAAMAGFTGMGAVEAALHASQDTRELSESAVNVAAATLVSGGLGTLAAGLSKGLRAKLAREAARDLGERRVAGGVGYDDAIPLPANSAEDPGAAEVRLSKALGADRLTERLRMSPGIRIAVGSPSVEARKMLQQIAETGWYYEKNDLGEATPVSAEARVLAYQSVRAELVRAGASLYRSYRRRLAGLEPVVGGDFTNRAANALSGAKAVLRRGRGPGGAFSRDEFLEQAGRAARRGDEHSIPEVAQLAKTYREKLFDPIKDDAIALKLLPEDVKVETALSYLTRRYKRELLIQDPGPVNATFIERTAYWLRSEHPEVSMAQAREMAAEIRDRIVGLPAGRNLVQSVALSKASPLKSRTFTIPDSEIEDFLESNIEKIGESYLRTMAPDLELQRMFGTTDFDEAAKPILDEFEKLMKAAAPAQRSKLAKRRAQDVGDLSALWDMLRGTLVSSRGSPPDAILTRAGRVTRQATYLGLGGGFLVNALPDLGRVVMTQGLARTFGAPLRRLASGSATVNLVKREVELAGAALETLLDTRALSLADIGDDMGAATRFERGMSALASNFSLLNGLSPWNTAAKHTVGIMVHQRILEVAERIAAKESVAARDVRDLAQLGIGTKEAEAIANQFARHGEKAEGKRLWLSNTDAWDSASARESFRVAMRRAADQVIVTPGIADRPISLVSSELGRLVGQFRTFGFAAVNRAVIPMMQQLRHFDVATMNGLLVQSAIGMMVYALKTRAAGKPLADPERDLNVWIAEGLDRSGAFGFYSDINNIVEVMSRGTLGLNAVFGGPVLSRYASRNYIGSLLGPQVSRLEDIAKFTGALATQDASRADVHAMRRLIPYNSLFYLRFLFDQAEESAAKTIGATTGGTRR